MPSTPSIPLPPLEFQELVCGPQHVHLFDEAGRGVVNTMAYYGMLAPGADLLDVGCGCGRVARHLLDAPLGSYRGFDRHPGMIAWANTEIAARDARFRFRLVEVKSAYDAWDAHVGRLDANALTFPYPDASFDGALASSVFTHMPPDDTHRYLQELHRVLRPGGTVLLSIFFAEDAAPRSEFVNFLHSHDAFTSTAASIGFHVRQCNRDLAFGFEQNWYLLTRAA